MTSHRSRTEYVALSICLACLCLFVLNILAARFALVPNLRLLHLERAPEFLLLFGTAVGFAVAALAAEKRHNANENNKSHSERATEQ